MSQPDPVSGIRSILEKYRAGELSALEALRLVHETAESNLETLRSSGLEDEILEIEYALAYNAIVNGASPGEVRETVFPGVWDRIVESGVIPSIAEYMIASAVLEGDRERAASLLESYREYLPEPVLERLEALLDPVLVEIVSSVQNEDYERLYNVISKLEGKPLKVSLLQTLSEVYGLDLGELRRAAYQWKIYDILSQAETVDEVLARIDEARALASQAGLVQLARDLGLVETAIQDAREGDLEGMLSALESIGDEGLRRYAILASLSELYTRHPDVILGVDEGLGGRLERLLAKTGYELDLDSLKRRARAVIEYGRIARLIQEGETGEARRLWEGLPDEVKREIATLLAADNESIDQLFEDIVRANTIIGRARQLSEHLAQGDYAGAGRLWDAMTGEMREAVARLLETSPEELDYLIRLGLALEELSKLENPDLATVKNVLARYLGGELAERAVRELMEQVPLFKVKVLVEQGEYERALEAALAEVPEEERADAVRYVLYSVLERLGPGEVARLVAGRREQLEGLVGPELMDAVSLYVSRHELARMLEEAVEEAASELGTERIQRVWSELLKLVEAGRWEEAERLLVENRGLLENVTVGEDGGTLLNALLELLTVSRLAEWAGRAIERVEEAASGGPDNKVETADRVLEELETWRESVRGLRLLGEQEKGEILAYLDALEALARALKAEGLLEQGETSGALKEADKARKLSSAFEELYARIKMVDWLVSRPEAVLGEIDCILSRLPGEGRRGRKPGVAPL